MSSILYNETRLSVLTFETCVQLDQIPGVESRRNILFGFVFFLWFFAYTSEKYWNLVDSKRIFDVIDIYRWNVTV